MLSSLGHQDEWEFGRIQNNHPNNKNIYDKLTFQAFDQ